MNDVQIAPICFMHRNYKPRKGQVLKCERCDLVAKLLVVRKRIDHPIYHGENLYAFDKDHAESISRFGFCVHNIIDMGLIFATNRFWPGQHHVRYLIQVLLAYKMLMRRERLLKEIDYRAKAEETAKVVVELFESPEYQAFPLDSAERIMILQTAFENDCPVSNLLSPKY